MLHVLAAVRHTRGSEHNNNPYIDIYKKNHATLIENLTAASTPLKERSSYKRAGVQN